MSQSTDILKHLRRAPITALQALERFGCMRLAARIEELRVKGHSIKTEMIKVGQREKKIARYRLKR